MSAVETRLVATRRAAQIWGSLPSDCAQIMDLQHGDGGRHHVGNGGVNHALFEADAFTRI